MNSKTKIGFQIIQIAVVLGVLGDVLLRAKPWGLNVFLFNLAFVLGLAALLRWRTPGLLNAQTIALLGAQLFFAGMFAWRDSDQLRVADSFAILAILSVLFLSRLNIAGRVAGVVHYAIGFLWAGFTSFLGPLFLVFGDVEWSNVPKTGWRKHAFAVIRGLAIASPLILIFGALFVAADAAFEGLVTRVLDVQIDNLFSHVVIFSFFGWLSAGYFRGMLINPIGFANVVNTGADDRVTTPAEAKVEDFANESGEYPITLGDRTVVEHLNISDPPDWTAGVPPASTLSSEQEASSPDDKDAATDGSDLQSRWRWPNIDNSFLPNAFTLGTIEVAIVLGLMNLLFLSFVIVQVPYLFGGMELVQNRPDFKLAEYARRGFGELVAVSALVLPVLLFGQWLIRKDSRTGQTLFRILAGTQIVLLFVIMASAVQRLVLLTGNLGYGMTTVRLYPLIFMSWLAVVFIWFGLTVLRGARQYFAWGALWSAFFFLGATHVLNPDEFIVKTNIALMRQGRPFDARYNASLSQDAIPTLAAAIPELSLRDQCTVRMTLFKNSSHETYSDDLRSWNLSRAIASSLIRENDEAWVARAGECGQAGLMQPVISLPNKDQ